MATEMKPLDINLAAVLAILEQETSSYEDKSDAYSQMTKYVSYTCTYFLACMTSLQSL